MNFTFTDIRGLGGCTDVAARGGQVFVIQNNSQTPSGRLTVLAADDPFRPTGGFDGIGNARQIAVSGTLAAVASREDGLFLFDISGGAPRLLSHYATLEFATGLALDGSVAYVCCRNYGVEVIDISDPVRPRHMGIIRVGEAQSACVGGGYLYCGIWGAMAVAVVDVHDPARPRVAARIPLGGRGDGVTVKDGVLYAVTGQHARGIKNIADEGDPCYGSGNGVEFFDIADPERPRRIYADSFGKAYEKSHDTWRAYLCGGLLVCTDSVLGIYVYDTAERRRLLHLPMPAAVSNGDINRADCNRVACNCVVYNRVVNNAVMGAAMSDGMLFAATSGSGLCAVNLRGIGASGEFYAPTDTDYGRLHDIAPEIRRISGSGTLNVLFREAGKPVFDTCVLPDGCLALACGDAGIRLVGQDGKEAPGATGTGGVCSAVDAAGDYVYAAAGGGGVRVFRYSDGRLIPAAEFGYPLPVKQLKISRSGRYAVCVCGSRRVITVDFSDFSSPRIAAELSAGSGNLYGGNFAPSLMNDGRILLFWHRAGLVYTNPDAGDTGLNLIHYERHNGFNGFNTANGIDTDGGNILYNGRRGYSLLPLRDGVFTDGLPLYRAAANGGRITVCGGLLVCCEGAEGAVTVSDISDLTLPRTAAEFTVSSTPCRALYRAGRILIPCLHGGLLEYIK